MTSIDLKKHQLQLYASQL